MQSPTSRPHSPAPSTENKNLLILLHFKTSISVFNWLVKADSLKGIINDTDAEASRLSEARCFIQDVEETEAQRWGETAPCWPPEALQVSAFTQLSSTNVTLTAVTDIPVQLFSNKAFCQC